MDEAEIVIKHEAKQLKGQYGWRKSDRDDIRQELWVAVLVAWLKYDPSRGPYMALAHSAIKNRIRGMIKHRKAEMRDYRRLSKKSLDRKKRDEEDVKSTRGRLLPTDVHDLRFGRESRNDPIAGIDVQNVVATLPGDLHDIATLLMVYTKTETARRLGIPRSSLYRKIEKLESVFRRAGVVPDHARKTR